MKKHLKSKEPKIYLIDVEYLVAQKIEREYKPLRYSDKELLEIFPEAKKVIPKKIGKWKKKLAEKREKVKSCLKKIYSYDDLDEFSIWFMEKYVEMFLVPEIIEIEKQTIRLRRMKSTYDPNYQHIANFQKKLERARIYPIEEIARSKLEMMRKIGDKYIALCPFHNEKTPSFYIYPETNTFHCFGCQKHGDIIKLTQHLYGVGFKNAVEMLQN